MLLCINFEKFPIRFCIPETSQGRASAPARLAKILGTRGRDGARPLHYIQEHNAELGESEKRDGSLVPRPFRGKRTVPFACWLVCYGVTAHTRAGRPVAPLMLG